MSEFAWIPPVIVAMPILLAALPLVLGQRWPRIGWWIATATTVTQLALVAALAAVVYADGPVRHALGGFERPIGIVLVADELSVAFAVLVIAIAVMVLGYIRTAGPRGWAFSSVYLLLVGGLVGITMTGDLFNLFVFLEITGIATYSLVAAGRRPTAALAALKYLVIGTVGATFYLIGVGYLFAATGTLNMVDMAGSLAGAGSAQGGVLYGTTLVRAAFAFIFVGLATKIAIFPLHTWQPDAYAESHDAVSTFIAALVATVASYALIRVVFTVFTVDFFATVPAARWAMIALGVTSVLVGSGLAVVQSRIKRMLAYSSVAQFGLVLAAIGVAAVPGGSAFALAGAIVHLLGHAIMKAGLFAGAGVVSRATGARTVSEYAALGCRRPVVVAAMGVLGLSLVGVPPSIGFIGKWYIAIGAFEEGIWVVAAVVLVTTLLTLSYVARLLERWYFVPGEAVERPAVATDGGETAVSPGMAVVVVLTAAVVVILGFFGGVLFDAVAPFVEGVLIG